MVHPIPQRSLCYTSSKAFLLAIPSPSLPTYWLYTPAHPRLHHIVSMHYNEHSSHIALLNPWHTSHHDFHYSLKHTSTLCCNIPCLWNNKSKQMLFVKQNVCWQKTKYFYTVLPICVNHALWTDQMIHNRILSKVCCDVFMFGIRNKCKNQREILFLNNGKVLHTAYLTQNSIFKWRKSVTFCITVAMLLNDESIV